MASDQAAPMRPTYTLVDHTPEMPEGTASSIRSTPEVYTIRMRQPPRSTSVVLPPVAPSKPWRNRKRFKRSQRK